MNYFRRTKQDQFDNFHEENKLAKQILGERDYASINRIFKWLKYESVGEFIYYEKIDWPKILARHSFYDQSVFIKKKFWFLGPTLPLVRTYRIFYYAQKFDPLLSDLRKGLLEHLFEAEMDYNILVNYFNDFRSFLSSRYQSNQNHRQYLIQAEALLEKKRQNIEAINSEKVNSNVQNNINRLELSIPLGEERIVPFPPVKPIYLPKINSCLLSLQSIGIISSAEEAIVPFIQPGDAIYSKVIWNGEIISLVFFIEYLCLERRYRVLARYHP